MFNQHQDNIQEATLAPINEQSYEHNYSGFGCSDNGFDDFDDGLFPTVDQNPEEPNYVSAVINPAKSEQSYTYDSFDNQTKDHSQVNSWNYNDQSPNLTEPQTNSRTQNFIGVENYNFAQGATDNHNNNFSNQVFQPNNYTQQTEQKQDSYKNNSFVEIKWNKKKKGASKRVKEAVKERKPDNDCDSRIKTSQDIFNELLQLLHVNATQMQLMLRAITRQYSSSFLYIRSSYDFRVLYFGDGEDHIVPVPLEKIIEAKRAFEQTWEQGNQWRYQ